jgi:transposase
MRKSFDGLCGIVKCEYHKNILDGDYFVFFNRVLDRCKILLWDRDGLILIYRRLEQGRFQRPAHDSANGTAIEIDATTLTLILSGVDLNTAKRRKRFRPERLSSSRE